MFAEGLAASQNAPNGAYGSDDHSTCMGNAGGAKFKERKKENSNKAPREPMDAKCVNNTLGSYGKKLVVSVNQQKILLSVWGS